MEQDNPAFSFPKIIQTGPEPKLSKELKLIEETWRGYSWARNSFKRKEVFTVESHYCRIPLSFVKPVLFSTVSSDLEKRGDKRGSRSSKWHKILQDSEI